MHINSHLSHPIDINTGDILPGGYQVKELLGQGGYGAVYAGYDPGLEREVAIKVFTKPIQSQAAKRFRDEGRLLAKLNHPNIIQVFYVGQVDHGSSYLVMEKFGQGSLAQHFPSGTTPPFELAVGIIFQLLKALHQAHQAGILHRDIKPANLLLDINNNWVKLCDFGIARSQDRLVNQADTTREGHVIGTTHYIAPERFQGINDDPRSDLYSVGILFYKLLVGKLPFESFHGESLTPEALLYRIFHQPIDGLNHIPRRLARICHSLLARDIDHRSRSAQQAIYALQDAWSLPETLSNPHQVSSALFPQEWSQDTIADEAIPAMFSSQNDTIDPHSDQIMTQVKSNQSSILIGVVLMTALTLVLIIFSWVDSDKIDRIESSPSPSVSSTQKTSIIILGEDFKKKNHRERYKETEALRSKSMEITPALSSDSSLVKSPALEKPKETYQNKSKMNTLKNKKRSLKIINKTIPDDPFVYPSDSP
jgi:serine/threonine protein kinase